jgi:hypothetical protein
MYLLNRISPAGSKREIGSFDIGKCYSNSLVISDNSTDGDVFKNLGDYIMG